MGIQINGNTNNINAGIGSLSIEDLREIDIVGVATAANFKTGVSNLHSVGLSLSGGQIDVGSNIKLGNAGVVTATSYRGDGSQLTGISAGVSLANGADNRVITATGANALTGESNLTYDGNTLQVATDTNMEGIKIVSSGDTYNDFILSANRSGANNHIGRLLGQWNGGNAAAIVFNTGGDTSSKDDGEILFSTSNGGSSLSTRMKIQQDGTVRYYNSIFGGDNKPIYLGNANDLSLFHDSGGASIIRYNHTVGGLHFRNNSNADQMIIDSSGRVMIGTNSAGSATGDEFTIATSEHTGMTIRSGTSHEGNIFFADSGYGSAGIVRYDHSANAMIFKTNAQGTDKLRINANGDVTTTGSASFVRSNAGFTARAGDSVQITRSAGTPLEISRVSNDGALINFFRDTTGVAQIGWNGSQMIMGPTADTDVLKLGTEAYFTKKLNVDFTVSGSNYVAYFRNNNPNCYGIAVQEPATVNVGYPLLGVTNSSGQSHFRVNSGGLVYANSGTGTEKKAYFVRAWVNFDGSGGSAGQNRTINNSQNISSVYDNDQGDFTINFSTNMPHSNYVITGTSVNWEGTNNDSYTQIGIYKNTSTVSSCRIKTIRTRFDQQPPQYRDPNQVMISIIC